MAIIRPPMVYGMGCKGNYQILRKFALMSPVFPQYKNERSMLYVENLAKFIQKVIDFELQGVFLPQDMEYVNTSQMVYEIAKCNKRKCRLCGIFVPFICFGKIMKLTYINKVFGNLTYEKCDVVYGKHFKDIIYEIEVEGK